jgi:hypothetical protein
MPEFAHKSVNPVRLKISSGIVPTNGPVRELSNEKQSNQQS